MSRTLMTVLLSLVPSLAFELRAAADRGPLWLEVTGRPGAKAFMKEEFGL